MKYHNEVRTHLSLEKDAPVSRAVEKGRAYLLPPHSGRPTSPIRPHLIYDRHRPSGARDEFLLAATAQNLRKLAMLILPPALKPA
jgi:hypothetical protein